MIEKILLATVAIAATTAMHAHAEASDKKASSFSGRFYVGANVGGMYSQAKPGNNTILNANETVQFYALQTGSTPTYASSPTIDNDQANLTPSAVFNNGSGSGVAYGIYGGFGKRYEDFYIGLEIFARNDSAKAQIKGNGTPVTMLAAITNGDQSNSDQPASNTATNYTSSLGVSGVTVKTGTASTEYSSPNNDGSGGYNPVATTINTGSVLTVKNNFGFGIAPRFGYVFGDNMIALKIGLEYKKVSLSSNASLNTDLNAAAVTLNNTNLNPSGNFVKTAGATAFTLEPMFERQINEHIIARVSYAYTVSMIKMQDAAGNKTQMGRYVTNAVMLGASYSF